MLWLWVAWGSVLVEGVPSQRVIRWTIPPDSLESLILQGAFPAYVSAPYLPYVDLPIALAGDLEEVKVQSDWREAHLSYVPQLWIDRDGLDVAVKPWEGEERNQIPTWRWHLHQVGLWRYITLRVPLARLRNGQYETVKTIRITLKVRPYASTAKSPPPYLVRTVVNPQDLRPSPKKFVPGSTQGIKGEFKTAALWVRMAIPKTGWYAFTGEDLKRLGLEGLLIQTLAVYTTGGDTLDGTLPDPFAALQPTPVEIHDGATPGVLDPQDTLFFFAEGPKGYRFVQGKWQWFDHPYTDTIYAWLGIGGTPSPSLAETTLTGSGNVLDVGLGFFRHEVNRINLARKGLRWEGEEFYRPAGMTQMDTSFAYTLPDTPQGPGQLRVSLVTARNYQDYREVQWAVGSQIGKDSLLPGVTDRCRLGCEDQVVLSPSGRISLSLRWFRPEEDLIYLDYIELTYPRSLDMRAPQELWSFPLSDTGLREIVVRGEVRWVLDVSNPRFPKKIGGVVQSEDTTRFLWHVDSSTRILTVTTPYRPSSFTVDDLGALWRVSQPADYVILYPRVLASAVGPYSLWRSSHIPRRQPDGTWEYDTGRVVAYAVEDVFRSFGFGVRDPVAIRNFLVFLAQQGLVREGESFVLLMGDGHYDYKGYTESGANLIPPYEPFEAIDVNESYLRGAWDDFFVDLDASGGPISGELFIGRLPVGSASEVLDYLDLIKRYERHEVGGIWHNRVVLVADDEYADNRSNEAFHTVSSDRVYHGLPSFVETLPVYLIQYPRTQRSQKGQDALVQAFNEGSAVLNFFGHGNPVTLTHEDILPSQAYARLQASHRPTVAIFASCKVGAYDRLDPRAVLGETFLLRGVATGTISSSAVSFAFTNELYVLTMINALMAGPLPLGELYLQGKNQPFYLLLGDPAVLVGLPQPTPWSVQLPDTFFSAQAFSYQVVGTSEDSTVWVSLRIPPRDTTYVGGVTISYTRPSLPLFTGPAEGWPAQGEVFVPILNGVDSLEFVAVGSKGSQAREALYRPYRSRGEIPVGEGPSVEGWLDGQHLQENKTVQVPQHSQFRLVVRDSEGIARQGGLQVEALGTTWDLSGDLQFTPGDYREAVVETPLTLPLSDSLDLVVRAVDNVGQVTTRRFPVRVLQAGGAAILSFLPYPNPWRRRQGPLTLSFTLGQSGRVTIRLFSIHGKEVYRFPERTFPAGYHQVLWWGQTQGGEQVAGGVYVALIVWKDGSQRETKRTGIFVVP